MIGLVIPRTTSAFFTDPYFPQLTQGVAFACNNHHLTLSLFLVGNQEDENEITPRLLRRGMLMVFCCNLATQTICFSGD